MRKRALTLAELLVAIVMFAIIAMSLARAFAVAIHYELNAPAKRQAIEQRVKFEDRIRAILQSAYISSNASDNSTYLIGTKGGQNPNGSPVITQNGAAATSGAGASTNTNSAAGGQGNSDSSGIGLPTMDGIVLTTLGTRVPSVYLNATGAGDSQVDWTQLQAGGGQQTSSNYNPSAANSGPSDTGAVSDLASLNATYGPQGGVAEIALSTTPVGSPPNGASGGLYERLQRPADADYTQGGTEQLFDADIATVGFQFYDGLEWVNTWDTTQPNQHRLPAAIKVSYTFTGEDPNSPHAFIVRIPESDVTPNNPVSTQGGTGTTAAPARPGGGGGTPAGAAALLSPSIPNEIDKSDFLSAFSNLKLEPDGTDGGGSAQSSFPPSESPPPLTALQAGLGGTTRSQVSAQGGPLALHSASAGARKNPRVKPQPPEEWASIGMAIPAPSKVAARQQASVSENRALLAATGGAQISNAPLTHPNFSKLPLPSVEGGVGVGVPSPTTKASNRPVNGAKPPPQGGGGSLTSKSGGKK